MPDSRAVTMAVSIVDIDICSHCGEEISADTDKQWVVANVYEDCCREVQCRRCRGEGRRWERLDHLHVVCYGVALEPYGPAPFKKTKPVRGEVNFVPLREEWEEDE